MSATDYLNDKSGPAKSSSNQRRAAREKLRATQLELENAKKELHTARKKKKLDALAAGLKATPPERIDELLRSTGRINIRVSGTEKADIQSTAQEYGLTITEYLLSLHRIAKEVSK